MQEITLSQYSAEIERLLQDEAYDEAIAHAQARDPEGKGEPDAGDHAFPV